MHQLHTSLWGMYHVVMQAGTYFLQIFLCEKFEGIAPKPVKFPKVEILKVMVGGLRKQRNSAPFTHKAWR